MNDATIDNKYYYFYIGEYGMKKIFILISLIIFALAGKAYAEGMVFDPTEFEVVPETNEISEPPKELPEHVHSNANISEDTKESQTYAQNAVSSQSNSFNNALFELDNAQVNIRNELLDYKAKYQEIDTQYQLIKEQRKVLGEQIKSVERKIRDIEKSKNNIRKTMI